MADTGAPHFIPYVEPTDLVRDYPAADEAQAEAVADALDAIPVLAGIGSNVVQTVKTNSFVSTSDNFTEVTGMTATITPSSNTSRILVICYAAIGNTANDRGSFMRLVRGATPIFVGTDIGSRVAAAFGDIFTTSNRLLAATPVFLDAPTTNAPVTYALQVRRGTSGSVTVNRHGGTTNDTRFARTPSSLTLIEVAA